MQPIICTYIKQLEDLINEANLKGDKYLFQDPAFDLIDEIEELDNSADFVEPIFKLIERSPNIDFGGPGPFGHFLEKFSDKGNGNYEEQLILSLQRKPTEYTIFLLHRLCNNKYISNRNDYIALYNSLCDTPYDAVTQG
jgi:hypothetical protein